MGDERLLGVRKCWYGKIMFVELITTRRLTDREDRDEKETDLLKVTRQSRVTVILI